MLFFWNGGGSFGGTGNQNAIEVAVDPDGVATTDTTNDNGKSVAFWLFYNGRIASNGLVAPGTIMTSVYNPYPAADQDPQWFHW
jgi:hypothetical protein